MFVMLYNMLRTHQGGADRASTPSDDISTLQNEQVMYVPDDNYRNTSREAQTPARPTDYFNHLGALAGQDRI